MNDILLQHLLVSQSICKFARGKKKKRKLHVNNISSKSKSFLQTNVNTRCIVVLLIANIIPKYKFPLQMSYLG